MSVLTILDNKWEAKVESLSINETRNEPSDVTLILIGRDLPIEIDHMTLVREDGMFIELIGLKSCVFSGDRFEFKAIRLRVGDDIHSELHEYLY